MDTTPKQNKQPPRLRKGVPLARMPATMSDSCDSSPLCRSPASDGIPSPLFTNRSPSSSVTSHTTPTHTHPQQCSSSNCVKNISSNTTPKANRPPNLLREMIHSNGSSSDCICVPPVLLSPVLSRPVRSLSAASTPLPIRQYQGSDSESDAGSGNIHWRGGSGHHGISLRRKTMTNSSGGGGSGGGSPKEASRPNTPVLSPMMKRSASGSRLAAAFGMFRGNSGSGSTLMTGRSLLHRNDSDLSTSGAADRRAKRNRRRTMVIHGMCSESSMDSSIWSNSTSNLVRVRSSLGHSDPQISASSPLFSASTSALPMARNTKDVLSQSNARASAARRSLNASTSPVSMPRCRSPQRPHPAAQPSTSSSSSTQHATGRTTVPVPLRSYSTRSGSSLMAPVQDNRRWSLASLPSTSGYGTPGTGSNSAFSSQYSSSEHLGEMFDYMRMSTHANRFDSNESYPSEDATTPHAHHSHHFHRPRSRSLTSPIKFMTEYNLEMVNRTSVYKERFPKAKVQMEDRLASFVSENGPLSGGITMTTSTSANSNENDHVDEAVMRNNRRSTVLEAESYADRSLLRIIGDGATRFLHHQIVEVAADCLARSRDDSITCSYFCEMSQRLDETLNEAQMKTSAESLAYLSKLVKQLLMIVSRPARLLECLEFDPDEFYHLLEEAEGVVREQLGSGTARVPDLPQYIIGKLGLDRDPLLDSADRAESPPAPVSSASNSTEAKEGSKTGWPSEQRAPCEDDFETIRLVSNGAYGAVYLVRHRETRQRFALKKMNKQTLMLRNQVDQVFAERDILTMADNPFVVSFYGSFETRQYLCMLMEYVEGGDCAALLKNAGTLPIDLTRLYVAETVLAIEYLHSYGIVHRDLKPDNLLITAMGHIKLTDFGLSKIGLMNRTTLVAEGYDAVAETQQFKDKQLCGTPEYIAPEVILRQGYGKPVDWWALGVILYEFLVGIVPFFGESPEDLFSKVITEEVEYPDGDEALPPEAEDLMRQLLEKNSAERLGTIAGASQLMAHPFFESLDFTSLLRQKAEFVPQLDNEEDTSYFDTRSDRYNHDAESCGEEDSSALMFHSFSTASPRHSIVSIDPAHLPHLMATAAAQTSSGIERSNSVTSSTHRKPSTTTQSSEEQTANEDALGEVSTAVNLRRRFSAQRHTVSTTSSSGTGSGTLNSCFATNASSTDSSIDASHLPAFHVAHAEQPLKSPLPRFAISYEGHTTSHDTHDVPRVRHIEEKKTDEVVPTKTEEVVRFRAQAPSPLQLVIPHNSGSGATSSSTSSGNAKPFEVPSASKDTSYVISRGGGQLSPGGMSVSSASSTDNPSPHPAGSQLADPQLSPAAQAAAANPTKPPITIRKGPFGFGFTLKSVRVYLAEHSEYFTIEHIVTSVVEGSPAYEAGLRGEDILTHVNSQPVHNLTHPQLMHRLLSYGNELTLKVTPLAATSIKEGAARKTMGKMAKKKPKRPQRRVPLEKKPRKPSALLRRLSGKRATNDIVPGSSSQKQTFIPRSVSSQDGSILTQPPGAPSTSGAAPTASAAPSQNKPISVDTSLQQGSSKTKRMSDVGLGREENRSPLASSRPSSLRHSTRPSMGSTSSTGSGTSGTPSSVPPVLTQLPGVASGAVPPKASQSIAVSPLARDVRMRSPSPSRMQERRVDSKTKPYIAPLPKMELQPTPAPRKSVPTPQTSSTSSTSQQTSTSSTPPQPPQQSSSLASAAQSAQNFLNRLLPRHESK